MKKLLILCLAFVFILASCKGGNQDKDKNLQNSDSGSSAGDSTASNESQDDNTENEMGIGGELTVDAVVEKSDAVQLLPAENTADLPNPEIIKAAGANSQALAMRKNILNAKDTLKLSGTTYYVSQKGDDANDGKSPKTPFATLNFAFSNVKSGDTILLERGSVFRLVNTVTLEDGATYGAYGTGAKPEVWGSIENYADSSLWTPHNIRNVWSISYFGSDVGIIVFNHGELAGNMEYYVRNLKKNGDYFFDDVQKVLYVYCDSGNPGNVYKDIEIGSAKVLFRLRNGAQNVKIDNISFKYTGTFGIHGSSGCKNIKITNCVVGWVGGSLFADGSNRYGNGIEFTAGCENLTVENCWIYQVYDAGFTFQITVPDGSLAERTYKNINVKNNLIEYCSWAFEWWPSDSECIFDNIAVDGNIMRFSGYGWAGDTRIPSHIRGSWSAKDYVIKNFIIKNNIFDCSNGPVYSWTLFNPEQFANSLLGNAYYQKMPTTTVKNVFKFDHQSQENKLYIANSQKEFNDVIKSVDSKATLAKWLS